MTRDIENKEVFTSKHAVEEHGVVWFAITIEKYFFHPSLSLPQSKTNLNTRLQRIHSTSQSNQFKISAQQ